MHIIQGARPNSSNGMQRAQPVLQHLHTEKLVTRGRRQGRPRPPHWAFKRTLEAPTPPAKHTQAQLKSKAGTEPAPQGSAMHTPQHESEASGKMPVGPAWSRRHQRERFRGTAHPTSADKRGLAPGESACETVAGPAAPASGGAAGKLVSPVTCRWDFRQLLAARCCGVCAVELRALGICDVVLGVKGDEREEDKKRPLLRHLQVSVRHIFRNRRRSIVALKRGSGLEEVIWKCKSELSHTVTTHVT